MGFNGEDVMSAGTVKGKVEAVARNGKAFKIVDDDEWYTVSKAAQLGVDSAADLRGAEVEFDFTTNDKGGKTWYNVKGNVNVTAEAPKTTTAAGTSANTKDVSMTRGGALKVAGDVVMRYYGENAPAELEEIAQDIIKLSRLLEAYVYEG